MNCLMCGQGVSMRDFHAHQAAHDAVRIGNQPEHREAVKDIVKADDKRMESHGTS